MNTLQKLSAMRNYLSFLFGILLCLSSGVSAQIPPESEWQEEGICARVRIRIEQEVAITRTAFQATLQIDNSPENVALENLSVALDIQNTENQPSNDLFGIKAPQLTGIDDVSGSGILLPGTSAKAVWILIPTRDAAPEFPTQYYVGGSISYTENGTQVTMPLFPASITVIPDPRLELDYFLQRVVYSDDPFTADIIEPAEPYPLGLILKNTGKGTAYNVNITSSQPEIIENEKGLLIDFKIIGTQVNTEQVSPSLTVNLGNIGPGETSVAQWIMTTSLVGKFIEYKAEFEHTDDLGDPRLSIIDSVNIHDIIHAVRIDVPDDDLKPDFLADDIDDPDFMPDTLYSSDGSTFPVNVISDASVNTLISNDNLQTTLSVNPPSGWVYIRADDPGQENFILKQVIRSDGREIRVEDNAWTTHRTIRLIGQPVIRQHLLHILDHTDGGSYQYTLIYENQLAVPEPPVIMFIPDRSFPEGLHFGFLVKASDPNGTVPAISASPLPDGAVFTDRGNGEAEFDWATQTGDAGEYEITFSASDGELIASRTAILSVYPPTDTDGDGMPDEWEMENFNTLERDGSGDFDNDGITDLEEYLLLIGPLLNTNELILAVEPADSGMVSPSEGIHPYPQGGVVKIEAWPNTGYRFAYWKGNVTEIRAASTTVQMDTSKTVTAVFISDSAWNLDIDGNGTLQANKDGFLLMRYLYNVRGENLIAGALGTGASRTTAAEIEEYIAQGIAAGVPDIDGNQTLQANKDGFLIMRYCYNVRGENLLAGAVGSGAARITAAEIEAYIQSLYP